MIDDNCGRDGDVRDVGDIDDGCDDNGDGDALDRGPGGFDDNCNHVVDDLDDDGDLDVITCEETSNLGVIWYENPLHK